MLQPQHITEYFIERYIKPDDIAVDATAGNGHDTAKLCRAVGKNGKVYAFDIQNKAIENTRKLLKEEGLENATLIQASHSDMDKYITESVKAVLFNLGYLPGGDHNLQTKYTTTLPAIEKSLEMISDDGFVSVTIYYGKNSGTVEKDMVMEYLKGICHKRFTVTIHDFYNRPNNPPITAIITKNVIQKNSNT